jgi:hypothetical protein
MADLLRGRWILLLALLRPGGVVRTLPLDNLNPGEGFLGIYE